MVVTANGVRVPVVIEADRLRRNELTNNIAQFQVQPVLLRNQRAAVATPLLTELDGDGTILVDADDLLEVVGGEVLVVALCLRDRAGRLGRDDTLAEVAAALLEGADVHRAGESRLLGPEFTDELLGTFDTLAIDRIECRDVNADRPVPIDRRAGAGRRPGCGHTRILRSGVHSTQEGDHGPKDHDGEHQDGRQNEETGEGHEMTPRTHVTQLSRDSANISIFFSARQLTSKRRGLFLVSIVFHFFEQFFEFATWVFWHFDIDFHKVIPSAASLQPRHTLSFQSKHGSSCCS